MTTVFNSADDGLAALVLTHARGKLVHRTVLTRQCHLLRTRNVVQAPPAAHLFSGPRHPTRPALFRRPISMTAGPTRACPCNVSCYSARSDKCWQPGVPIGKCPVGSATLMSPGKTPCSSAWWKGREGGLGRYAGGGRVNSMSSPE